MRKLDLPAVTRVDAAAEPNDSVRTVGGVDEAGRGCILGPLVVAGVSVDRAGMDALSQLGVRDSKVLSARRREQLYDAIRSVALSISFLAIPPSQVDSYVRYGTRYRRLNFLEALYMARIITDLAGIERVFIDAPDVNPSRFSAELSQLLPASSVPHIVAEHRADSTHPIVSAASIVAKVERDKAVQVLRETHGDFGSGYPSDEKTISFLSEWVRRERDLPHFSRKSWKTWERILTDSDALTLYTETPT